jgi:hypothetical protein
MVPNAHFVAEISALRYELLGDSDTMRSAAQYACRRYQGILSRMNGTDDLRKKITAINESLERAALFRGDGLRSDVIRRAITELRMTIDMHLHTLSTSDVR